MSLLSRVGLVVALLFAATAFLASRAAHPSGQLWAGAGLVGRVVVLDAGHGGVDPGASSKTGILEKDVVLGIAFHLKEFLEGAGGRVVMTRTEDRDVSGYEDPWHPRRYKRDLHRRAEIIETSGADAMISIHANADPDNGARGAQAFFQPDPAKDPTGQSRRLAMTVQKELLSVAERPRTYTSSDIHQLVLRRAPMPAATVEVGFLTNRAEAELLNDTDYQRRMAWAIFLGVSRFFAEGPDLVTP